MSKCKLTWYKTKANKLMKLLRGEKQKDIMILLNLNNVQTVSHRMREVYPEQLEEWLQLLDMIGYEVREKDESISD